MKNQEQTKRAPFYKFLLAVLLLTQAFVLYKLWNVTHKETGLRAMAEKASRSVGMVMLEKNGNVLSSGSCFVTQLPPNNINNDTIIVATAHVFPDSLIEDDSVRIIVGFPGKRKLLGVVVQIKDEEIDLAVLTPSDTTKYNLPPPLTLGNSDALEVFSEVVLIGTHKYIYNVASKGYVLEPIVSRKLFGKSIFYNHFTFILSNVSSNYGCSGGPLLNMDGEVVGVHHGTTDKTGEGLSIDIPSNELMYFLSLHSLELRK